VTRLLTRLLAWTRRVLGLAAAHVLVVLGPDEDSAERAERAWQREHRQGGPH